MALHPQAQQFLDIVAGAPPLDTRTVEQNRAISCKWQGLRRMTAHRRR